MSATSATVRNRARCSTMRPLLRSDPNGTAALLVWKEGRVLYPFSPVRPLPAEFPGPRGCGGDGLEDRAAHAGRLELTKTGRRRAARRGDRGAQCLRRLPGLGE